MKDNTDRHKRRSATRMLFQVVVAVSLLLVVAWAAYAMRERALLSSIRDVQGVIEFERMGPESLRDAVCPDAVLGVDRAVAIEFWRAGPPEKQLAQIIAKLPMLDSVRHVGFRNMYVRDRHMHSLTRMKSLESLDLGNTQITDEAAKHLAQITNLSALSLDYTDVTDASVPYLARIQSLRQLSIEGTGISARGLAELRRQLPKCDIEWSRRSTIFS